MIGISQFIEKHFWIFLLTGIILGLWKPVRSEVPPWLPEILLGMMLFLVFLKIDALEVLEKIRDFRLMIFISLIYMIILPLAFYFATRIFDSRLAIGILLLTAMPAGVSSPALVDILKGNISLAMSIAIVTQMIAPFTVPLLFWLIGSKNLNLNILLIFKDIALLVFLPMILAQAIKKFLPETIRKGQHLFTSINVFVLVSFVYIALSSQRDAIVSDPASLVWKTIILYMVFIALHFIGYFLRRKEPKENKITFAITSAYMNNGMAIVLASTYFGPDILILMVLSELPWNTLLAPFKKIAGYLN